MTSKVNTYFTDLDGGWCTREARQARLEGRDLAERTPATGVDSRHPELVRCAWLQLLFLQFTVVWYVHHIYVL